jgi:hypothetical protein
MNIDEKHLNRREEVTDRKKNQNFLSYKSSHEYGDHLRPSAHTVWGEKSER